MSDAKYPEHSEVMIVDLASSPLIEAGWQIMDIVAVQRVESHQEEVLDPAKADSYSDKTTKVWKPFLVNTHYAICGRTSDARAETAENQLLDLKEKIKELGQAKTAAEEGRDIEEERYSKLKESHSEITSLRDEDAGRIRHLRQENLKRADDMQKLEKAIGSLKIQEVLGA